jgi:uncharacterized secreted protein with C-terminal beta-propeller domain
VEISELATFEETPGGLKPTSVLKGLGANEAIYAVRFFDNVGYVVTYRRIDPLYTIDLTNPAQPKLAGELKVPGYSTYLYPIRPGQLLAIGRDENNASQLSLFDVRDLKNPRRTAALSLPNASLAETEPHAFLWWPNADTLVIPSESPEDENAGFAALVSVTGERFASKGIVNHPVSGENACTKILRSVIVNNKLVTISENAVAMDSLTNLSRNWFIDRVDWDLESNACVGQNAEPPFFVDF